MTLHTSGVYAEQDVYTDIHKLLMIAKLSHYRTKSFAGHEAFGRAYDGLNDLVDSITEKLIGYSGIDPVDLTFGTISTLSVDALGSRIITVAGKIEEFATKKKFVDICNLTQELSGLGAQIRYLSRFA